MTLFIGCPYVCDNKNSLGFCKTTACINPKYNGSGTFTVVSDHTELICDVYDGTRSSEEVKSK